MNVIDELIIIAGISLDIFAAMECQGSLVPKIEKKHLALMCGVLIVGQAAALGIGTVVSVLLRCYRISEYEIFLEGVLAAIIFFCMGIRLLLKAWKNEGIIEHRKEKFNMPEFLRLWARNSIFALLTGIAVGFLNSNMMVILVMVTAITAAAAVLGMYTGYR